MQTTALAKSDFDQLCSTLYSLAQKHIPASALSDVTELVHVAKILERHNIPLKIAPKIAAHATDYSSSVVKQSPEYRLMRARFAAALGTIADMGSKKIKKNKSEFHAGINEGLRRAAKIAIMFLEDLDANINIRQPHDNPAAHNSDDVAAAQPRSGFVR
jgi:hypothetical protein